MTELSSSAKPDPGRGAIVAAVLTLGYLSYVFQIYDRPFWNAGLRDWVDPYFLNWIMEHWHRWIGTFSDPFSPPVFFRTDRVLGRCGHPLIFYVPFYEVVRPFLHPFVAYNAALFLVIATGAISLFVLLRKATSVSNVEALVLTALFVTSKNVINGMTETWSQRVSVFIIPPILLLVLLSRSPVAAFAGGLAGALLFSHDFYTAAFAMLIPIAFLPLANLRGSRTRRWWISFAAGALLGLGVFVWLYLPAYRYQPAFPLDQILREIWPFAGKLNAYDSHRSFELIALVAVLALLPWPKSDLRTRALAWWFAFLSIVVLFIPWRVGGFSIWMSVFARLPGSGAIRDPKRIIYLYELAVVLVMAVVLSRVPAKVRVALTLVIVVLIATDWNRHTFEYERPVAVFDDWVDRPIQIDPSCRSFFIAGASTEYMKRSPHMWTLYGVDAMFISSKHRLPTLNGYTGIEPRGWNLANPQEDSYPGRVDIWIHRRRLTNVCVFDIEPRTMRPYLGWE